MVKKFLEISVEIGKCSSLSKRKPEIEESGTVGKEKDTKQGVCSFYFCLSSMNEDVAQNIKKG